MSEKAKAEKAWLTIMNAWAARDWNKLHAIGALSARDLAAIAREDDEAFAAIGEKLRNAEDAARDNFYACC